ncbi:MAG: hypothetical protein A3B91_01645 [Candidatus Yanofskybacteria bacterium RIFCSPHIGHO2_02_FULL_41_29]|uniref:Uncharacterized protein n=1 Tax=Candidatus Yanofskybacteria bacterium RIFCSPHIGHO2_01_FULL_41_53 TaxID=1802663 RepID=A0A1F8EKH1_9BACT|nr:MAG: hypothetical protein A2650_03075 [Candidatus Yanofskybacteria bacterium RIFCSPHIGHO2_01_FULL_41_53]OGN11829.1 MAG: hypothetical protein A3B91_01645 [Candidatus Yanofskybacteria bacterium RIFCSPHIGHO2_02_FULL_41_29]OGN17265.1 MAG: hypothetical protein A3F48_03625 [Candidatus Yanofskybacteria bacterium RIFCSPHIGHO2_12_FULL_41_9]OGN23077.1 MAG: hypothetical protein A2916_04995 [Candidatus Yanofskybacteria bacterium RIFCSPLOWO2_01_FULL_41_67]OGN29880.1 MAG: hypothetical protein A3H54_03750 
MYDDYSVNPVKYMVISLLVLGILLGLFLLPLNPGKAQTNQTTTGKPASFSDALAANTLCSAGLQECGTSSDTQQPSGNLLSGLFSGSSNGPNFDPIISVVNVTGQTAVYRIINGKKHSIPTTEIFYSYGFDLNIVQEITKEELDKYPLARLFIVEGAEEENPTIYYLTDGGMIRPILNDKVFYSYGDRKEDVIAVSQKEFNYYPRNEFIFLERPKLDREIYQITGGVKRYLTPVAVKRMNLRENEVAPVNQIEFDEYPMGEAVIF